MFEKNWLIVKHRMSSLKHFLQIFQNLEFTDAKFLLWSERNFNSVNMPLDRSCILTKIRLYVNPTNDTKFACLPRFEILNW
jgi:hypothetical protein